jgi:mevalonate kinase
MPAISAYAPGKVILFGEHAVVYGRPAIAVPVDQVRARAVVTADPRAPAGKIHIVAPDVGMDSDLGELPSNDPLAVALRGVLSALGNPRPLACTVRITSTIPVAAGLGSGAAVSVALIRAFSSFLGRPLPDEQVSLLAYEVDKLHHGNPSGIDNTVITYAAPVYFMRGQAIETFPVPTPFTLVIGDSGVPSPTAIAVSSLRQAWQAEPDRYERYFDQVGFISQAARQSIEGGQPESLGSLMDENHALLCEMGVSSLELDRLVQVARSAGALGAKLSGAGRGGNIIALVTKGTAPEVAQALEEAGASRIIVTEVKDRE